MKNGIKAPLLVKFGGAAMENASVRDSVCRQIAELAGLGEPLIIVHGGGKEISRWIERFGGTPRFVNGLRVTDADTMTITEMVLTGSVNTDLVSRLSRFGVRCSAVSGRSNRTLTGQKLPAIDGVDMGWSGEVTSVDTQLLELLLTSGFVPVVSPIAETENGEPLNVNADYAAAAIAGALQCETCLFLTDVDGVRGTDGQVCDMTSRLIGELIITGVITGGMIPKVQCAVAALEAGCRRAIIANASREEVVSDVVQGKSVGTLVTNAA